MVSIRWYLGYLKGQLGGAGIGSCLVSCCLQEEGPCCGLGDLGFHPYVYI